MSTERQWHFEGVIGPTDQERFADLSGDRNPLHVDPVRARRSTFGAPVVHGVHLLLRTLATAVTATERQEPVRLIALDVEFRRHVPVGAPFAVTVSSTGEAPASGADLSTAWSGEIRRGSMLCTRIRWRTAPMDVDATSATPTSRHTRSDSNGDPCNADEPLRLDIDELDVLLPGLAAAIVSTDIAVLLATTRFVGMRCPGERALLRRITVTHDADGDDPPHVLRPYSVRTDPRLSLLTAELRGAEKCVTVEVLERPPRVDQAPMSAVRASIAPDRFAGSRVAVIGGSRGLGEVIVKLLVAGGSRVLVTSRYDGGELAELVAELGVTPLVLDAAAPEAEALDGLRSFAPTHLAYFAAPSLAPIADDDEHGIAALEAVLERGLTHVLKVVLPGSNLRGVLVPSTTYVAGAPAGLEPYAAIKRRVERSLDELQSQRADLHVRMPRLPPLLTDQTVGSEVDGASRTLDVLRSVIEEWIPRVQRMRLTVPEEQHEADLRSLAARTLGRDPYQASSHHLHWLWRCAPNGAGRSDSIIAVRGEMVIGMVHRLRLPWHSADGSAVTVPAVIDLAVEPGEPPSTALALLRRATAAEESAYIPASRGLASGLARLGAVPVPSTWWRRFLLPHPRALRWDGGAWDVMRLRDRVDGLHGTSRNELTVITRPSPGELDELSVLLAAGTAVAFTPELVAWRLFHRYGPPSAWLQHRGRAEQADLVVAFGVRRHVPFVRLVTALGRPSAIDRAVRALVRSASTWGAAVLLATVPADLTPTMRAAGLTQLRDAPSAWLFGGATLRATVRYDGLLGDLGLDGIPRDGRPPLPVVA